MDAVDAKDTLKFTVDARALHDYWRVYQDSIDEMNTVGLEAVKRDPWFAPMMAAMTPDVMAEQQRVSLARLWKGVNGDWSDYVTTLRRDAARYAEMGIPVRSWYDLLAIVNRALFPRMVTAFLHDPERLCSALRASQELIDGAMAILADTYVEAKQRHVEVQRQLAEQRAKELDASERSVRRRTAVLEAVIDSMRDGLALQSVDGEFLVRNVLADRVLSAVNRPGEAGRAAQGVFAGDGQTVVAPGESPLTKALGGQATQDIEMVLRDETTPAGVRFVVDGRPIFLDGKMLGGLITYRDVTERVRLQDAQRRSEELEKQNVMFQEASRLKSEFLANMSHELRTPLNAIIGFSELIRDGAAGPVSTRQCDYLDDVLVSSRHLLGLINDVLDLAKVEAGRLELHPEDMNLTLLSHEVVAVLRATASRKSLTVEIEADPTIPSVRLDPGRVKQILYNYLSNAQKFTPEGGRILLRLTREEPRAVRIEVSDSGPGIADSDQARLFREFEQVRAAGAPAEGTGLGLALTKRLVEAMGGSVGVRSRVGQGSTFYAVLPTRMARGSASLQNIVIAGASEDAPRILVIEDDAEDQAVLVRILTDHGYAVETAATAAQAMLRLRAERFDAITLDLILPDASGLDLLRSIRAVEINRTTPVIIVSVAAEERLALGYSVAGVLAKPVQPDALRFALEGAGVQVRDIRSVVVVDDDQASLRLAGASLAELGYPSVCCSDPLAALEQIRRERPSAVILDLLMPQIDGFTFLDRLRLEPATANIPVFVWTVKDLNEDELQRLRRHVRTTVLDGKRSGSSLIVELQALLPVRLRESEARVAHG